MGQSSWAGSGRACQKPVQASREKSGLDAVANSVHGKGDRGSSTRFNLPYSGNLYHAHLRANRWSTTDTLDDMYITPQMHQVSLPDPILKLVSSSLTIYHLLGKELAYNSDSQLGGNVGAQEVGLGLHARHNLGPPTTCRTWPILRQQPLRPLPTQELYTWQDGEPNWGNICALPPDLSPSTPSKISNLLAPCFDTEQG